MSKKYRYSEIFHSFQGEGFYTGRSTSWLRFFGCQFNCSGFGQKDPLDPKTWILDYENLDVSKYNTLEELPVFERGCDSGYSWSKKYAHLIHQKTVSEICDELENITPGNKFLHPISKQYTHLALTGGEPMMSQSAIVEIMDEFKNRNNTPKYITIETNTVSTPRDIFVEKFTNDFDGELFWSCSPKLFLSGEPKNKALRPDNVKAYFDISNKGQLKYVCDGSDRAWNEIEEFTNEFRKLGVDWDVYIMPLGGTKEDQEDIQVNVILEAMKRGFHVSPRVHCLVFGNSIGT